MNAVLSKLLQPVGEANKGEMFTRRQNKFCSIVYYIDMDKHKIQVCATFIVGNIAINIFTCEDMIYILFFTCSRLMKVGLNNCAVNIVDSNVNNIAQTLNNVEKHC